MSKHTRALALTLVLDAALVNVAFALSYYVRYGLQLFRPVNDAFQAPYTAYWPLQFWFTILMLIFLAIDGAYLTRPGGSWLEELYRIINATTTVGIILSVYTFIILPLVYSRLLLLEAVVLNVVLLGGARFARRVVQAQLRKRGIGVSRVLIVGAGEMGRAVMRTLVARPELGYHIVGFVDDDPAKGDLGRFRALGGLEAVEKLIVAERVDEIIITLPWSYHRRILNLVRAGAGLGVRARLVPDFFQLSLNRLDVSDLDGIPLIGLKEASIPSAWRVLKRGLDLMLAALALALAAVPMLIIALLVRLESPGAALFQQQRVGEHGRRFDIYKFRSMRQGAEDERDQLLALNEASGPLFKIKNDPRLTRTGKFLRRTSLDELPNIFNVLRGEMSLVGPRPGLPEEVAQYDAWQRQRLEVKPGITGLWQVSGRSDLSFEEMCLLDIYYIENWSLGMDFTILLRTIPRVITREGAY